MRWISQVQRLKELRNDKKATFIIFETPKEGIGFRVNLADFGKGRDHLP